MFSSVFGDFQVAVNFFCMPVYALQMLGTQRVPLEVLERPWDPVKPLQDMPMITVGGSKCLFGGQAPRCATCSRLFKAVLNRTRGRIKWCKTAGFKTSGLQSSRESSASALKWS